MSLLRSMLEAQQRKAAHQKRCVQASLFDLLLDRFVAPKQFCKFNPESNARTCWYVVSHTYITSTSALVLFGCPMSDLPLMYSRELGRVILQAVQFNDGPEIPGSTFRLRGSRLKLQSGAVIPDTSKPILKGLEELEYYCSSGVLL